MTAIKPNRLDIEKLASTYYEYFNTRHGLNYLASIMNFVTTIMTHPNKEELQDKLWESAMHSVEEAVRIGKTVSAEERQHIHKILNVYKQIIQNMSKSDPSIDKFLQKYFGNKLTNKQYGGNGSWNLFTKLTFVLALVDTSLKGFGIFHPTTAGSTGALNEISQQGIGGITSRALDSLSSYLGSEDASVRSNYASAELFQAADLVPSVTTRTSSDIVYDERYQTLTGLKGNNQVTSTTETIGSLVYFSLPQIQAAEQTLLTQEATVQHVLNTVPSHGLWFTANFKNAAHNFISSEYQHFLTENVKINKFKSPNHGPQLLSSALRTPETRAFMTATLEGFYEITNATANHDPASLYPLLTTSNSSFVANKTTFTSAHEEGLKVIQALNSRNDPVERGVLSRYTVNLIAEPQRIPQRYDVTIFENAIHNVLSKYELSPQEHDILYYSLVTQATDVANTNINLELAAIASQSVIKQVKQEEEAFNTQLKKVDDYVRAKYKDTYSYTQQTQIINEINRSLTRLHDARLQVKTEKLESLVDMLAPQIIDNTLSYEARTTVLAPLSRSLRSTHAKLTEAYSSFQFSLLGSAALAGTMQLLLSMKDLVGGIFSVKIDWTIGKKANNTKKLENGPKPNAKPANAKPANAKPANVPKPNANTSKPNAKPANVPKPIAQPVALKKGPAVRCTKERPCPEGQQCVKTYCKPIVATATKGGAYNRTRKNALKRRNTRRRQ